MEKNDELLRLEAIIDNLLTEYRKMKKNCAALESLLEERNAECAGLRETLEELRGERSLVGERVAGLIERIEQWENELEDDELPGEDEMARLQGKLFQGDKAAAK